MPREKGGEIPPETKAEAEREKQIALMKAEVAHLAAIYEKIGGKNRKDILERIKRAGTPEHLELIPALETAQKFEDATSWDKEIRKNEKLMPARWYINRPITTRVEVLRMAKIKDFLLGAGGVKSEEEWDKKYGRPFTHTLENPAEARDLLKLEK